MNSLAIKDIESPVKMMKYMWKKEWVRPHESLWSVMRNFRIVNGHCDYSSALKLLGIDHLPNPKKVRGYISRYGIYSWRTMNEEWKDLIDSQLLPEGYEKEISAFSRLIQAVPQMVSGKLYYCPKCMEYGYHSYFHQLSGMGTCPFHEGQKLKCDNNETYIWGESRRLEYDSSDSAYMRSLTFDIFEHHLCNFNDKIMGRLPSEWKEPEEFKDKIEKAGIYDKYDSIAVASSAVAFTNTDICGGKFFLSNRKRNTIVTIYDTEAAEAETFSFIRTECRNMGFNAYSLNEWLKHYIFYSKYVGKLLLLILSRKLLENMTTDRIRSIEGNFLTGGQISYKNHDDILVLFLWDYIGCRHLHEFISINDIDSLMNEELNHSPGKRYCEKDLIPPHFLYTFGVTAAMHVIKGHMEFCYQLFKKHLILFSSLGNERFGLDHRLDLFDVPSYIIEKRNGAIYIYMEM